jgi:hypothetical protein
VTLFAPGLEFVAYHNEPAPFTPAGTQIFPCESVTVAILPVLIAKISVSPAPLFCGKTHELLNARVELFKVPL